MSTNNIADNFQSLNRIGFGVPIIILLMLAMMVLPLPAIILDMLFTFNIILSLLVLLACIYANRPLEFSIFPSILLIATLLRLALNVASTRIVLLKGHIGTGAAGQVIKSFGEVVIGSNFAIGIIVFAILVIINFVVVTKGAGRISEVSARFTLDAMPGKQMAIDADLNAGLISQEEAKRRRAEISDEADFYGAMDGASKFVRGDALAGILILFINIIGGLIMGVMSHDMSFTEAGTNYTLLTIGDGLAAQIPSLLLSTAAAIMVTRVNSSQDLGKQVLDQLISNPRALSITAGVIASLGLIPGMPHLAFIGLGLVVASGAYYFNQQEQFAAIATPAQQAPEAQAAQAPEANRELGWEDVKPIDILGLEIGYKLIHLVDENKNGQLMKRVKGIRKKLSQELGFLIPSVHIKDNLDLDANNYRIHLLGVNVGEAQVYPNKDLAINPGQVFGAVEGINCQDPSFGLDAIWIDTNQREYAQSLGYTVVDPSTVIATHLSQIIQNYAHDLLGHEEVQQLLDQLSEQAPKLVESLVPGALPLSAIVKVLQKLLEEQIPVRDLRTIAETLIEVSNRSKDPEVLTAEVRVAIKRLIVQTINGNSSEVSVISLAPELEQILQQSLQLAADNGVGLEPGLAEKLHKALVNYEQQQNIAGTPAILLVSPQIRHHMAKFVRYSIPGLHVISYQEIPDDKQVKIVGSIGN